MYRDKTILAIVPARSGSKRIPDKSMQEINGVSLIGWAGRCLQELVWIDDIIFSTNSSIYAEEAEKHSLQIIRPLRRERLSQDDSRIEDVLDYEARRMEEDYQRELDIILLIEPTSPMRKPEDIKNAVDLLIDTGADSVVTVSEIDEKFTYKALHEFENRIEEVNEIPEGVYYRNGICYALTRDTVHKKQIITTNTLPLIIDRPVVNIDTPLELEIARMLMKDD